MGICTFSPRLDDIGNSARGVAFCRKLITRYSFHNYDTLKGLTHEETLDGKTDPRRNDHDGEDDGTGPLIWAAAENNLVRARQLLCRGFDINDGDYDLRTPLVSPLWMAMLCVVRCRTSAW